MADVDLLPPRGVPYLALVDANGIAIGGSSTVAQLASKGMKTICQVDPTGIASSDGATTVALLASRGIRAFAAVDENGVSVDDAVTKADAIRSRGIRPMVAVDANGLSQTGPATIPVIAQRGLSYFCPVDETGTAGSLIPVPPNTIRARPGIFTLTGETMTTVSGYVIQPGAGSFALAGQNATLIPPAAAYIGPGEVTGWNTAYGYWGLRAYTAAKIGANCIDVCANINGVAVSLTTVVIGANGYADLTPIGFSPIYVNRIYDQSGSQHLFFNGAFERPVLTASMVGGKPAMLFDGSVWGISTANAVAQAQPLTVAAVCRFNTWASNGNLLTDGSFAFQSIIFEGPATVAQYFGGGPWAYTGAADNSFASLISVANNASSSMAVNGTVTPVSNPAGTNGIGTTNKLAMGGTEGGGTLIIGYVYEIIIKAGAVSPTNQGLLNTNQHAIGAGW